MSDCERAVWRPTLSHWGAANDCLELSRTIQNRSGSRECEKHYLQNTKTRRAEAQIIRHFFHADIRGILHLRLIAAPCIAKRAAAVGKPTDEPGRRQKSLPRDVNRTTHSSYDFGKMKKNADGGVTIYIAPKPPQEPEAKLDTDRRNTFARDALL